MPIQDVKKTNEQHAIPQNFMDVEFKIIGSLTMRQFLYILVFFGLAYGVFALGSSPFRLVLVVLLGLLGLGLAFVPLEERGLDEWIINFFKSVYSPSQRVWRKSPELPSAFMAQSLEVVNQELITLAPTSSRRKLEEYLHERDSQEVKVDVLDIPEAYYTEKARAAFASEVMVSQQSAAPASASGQQAPPAPPPQSALKDISPVEKKDGPHEAKTPEPVEKSKQVEKPTKRTLPIRTSHEVSLTPLTPDRHSGRRFVDLTPGRGRIVLPIRGEKRIKTSEELGSEENIQEKTAQLQQLLSQLRGSASSSQRQPVETPPVEQSHEEEKIYKKVTELKKEIAEAKPPVREEPAPSVKAARPFIAKPAFVEEKPHLETPPFIKEIPTRAFEVEESALPNIVSGIVKSSAGKSFSNVVLIIKDERGSPVRALKTNSLGQFSISTPLENGNYTVEIDSTKKTGLAFDIISVPLAGKIVPPMELVGK